MLDERTRWLWRRLRAMTPAEVSQRALAATRDVGRRRAARRRIAAGGPWPGETPLPPAVRPQCALFWWGEAPAGGLEPALEGCCPGAPAALRAAAERVLAGEALLFGEWVSAGKPPDWHRDPGNGGGWPRVFAGDIDPRAQEGGAVRRVWELNRHHDFVTVAQAFALAGEARYAEGLRARWADWLAANPPDVGVNWTSGLEMAVRAVSWAWAWALLERGGELPRELATRAMASLVAQARWIEEHPSLYSTANNHRIGEAVALAAIGVLWPDLPRSEAWREGGLQTLARELERQVAPDGVSREQAFHYQAFVLDGCLWIIDLARRAAVPLPAALVARARAAARFLRCVMDTAGGIPAVGDSDDGWFLKPPTAGEASYRGLLQVAAVTFQDAALDPEGDAPEPRLFWRLGPAGVAAWRALRPGRGMHVSRAFGEGGYVVMRARPGPGERVCVFDCGALGLEPLCAHGHADALALTLSLGDAPALVDRGTYGYHEQPEWRRYFRGTRAHNTVTVDGGDQSEMGGPFLWTRAARTHRERWLSSPVLDLARARHDGYSRLGVAHRRTVLFGKPDTWMVVDELTGTGEHTIEQRFHLAPGAVEARPEGLTACGSGLTLVGAARPGLTLRLACGSLEPREGWHSPRYGCREPAPEVIYAWRGALPVTLVTVLAAAAAPGEVELVSDLPGALVLRLGYADAEEWVAIAPSRAFAAGGLSGAGEVAWLRLDADGRPCWLGGLHLERLCWQGTLLHEGPASVVDMMTWKEVEPG